MQYVHYTQRIAVWNILKRATKLFLPSRLSQGDRNSRNQTGLTRFRDGRTGFRRPHYKWPIRRRFPNELLKRTPRLLRIFKLGRYFQLACIWYRQPNATLPFHILPHSFSLSSFSIDYHPHTLFLGEKKKASNRLSFLLLSLPTLFILLIPYRVLPFFFFFLSLSSSVFQSVHFPRVVPFAPITRRRMIPYPKGDRNGKILSSPVSVGMCSGERITECTTGLTGRESEVGQRWPRKEEDFHFYENRRRCRARIGLRFNLGILRNAIRLWSCAFQ